MSRTQKALLLLVPLLLSGLAWFLRPVTRGSPYTPPFAELNTLLRQVSPGVPVAILDLDVLEANATRIQTQLGNRYSLRIVTKSLPSLPLLEHLMAFTGSRRLMAFSEVFVDALLDRLETAEALVARGKPAYARPDILLGKPLPVEAASRLLAAHPAAAQLQWLIDTPERLKEYLELAQWLQQSGQLERPLQISLELDVGLHRGGARTEEELSTLLEGLLADPGALELSGFMGYDGHVPHVPPIPLLFGTGEQAALGAFKDVLSRYETFVRHARARAPRELTRPLTLNSGGSLTYGFYSDQAKESSINDLALGSAFLVPKNFAGLEALGLRPALFLATPVLKKLAPGEVPFLDGASSLLATWDPNLAVGFGLMGGGWTGDPEQPPGLSPHFLLEGEGGVQSLLSNQRVLFGAPECSLEVGDFVFFRPWEGDALVTFEKVLVVRGQQVVATWETFRRGN